MAVKLSHLLNLDLITDEKDITNRTLIVDDISDTGRTLERYSLMMKGAIATLHYKPTSKVRPDYFYSETLDWIIYPWETEQTSKVDYMKGST